MTQNTASITFEVSGKRQDGTAFTVTKVQSLTKSVAGSNARTLKLEQTGLTFTRPQNTTTLDPGFIELNTSSSNLGGETVTFSTPVGVDLYTASTGGAVTTTATVGTPVYLRNSEFAGNTSVLVTATVSNSYGTFTDQSTFIELEEGKNSIASLLTNESHSFAADEDADVLSYTGGGTDIRIYEGATPLTYGTGDGQFTVSATVTSGTVTIGTATTVTTSTTNDTRRFGNPSGLDTVQASITFTISGKRQDGTVFSLTRIQSLTKSVAGSNARFIKLVTDGLTFSRPKNTTTLDPGFITLDTEHNNLSGSTVTYSTLPEVDLYDASSGGSVATTAVAGTPLYIRNSDFATNSPVVVTVTVSNSYGTFIDKATLVQLDEGSDSVQVVFDNEAHTFQADQDGTISDYSAGALNINVYEGTTQLDVGTGNGEYQVSASASNITAGTESDDGTTTTFGAPLNMTSTGASVAYTISGKRQDGTAFSFDKIQTFSKSLAGQDAYTLSMNMLSYTVEEQNDESLDAFSVDIEGTIFKGSVNKTADYQISAIEAYTQAGAPNQEASLGLGSFTPDGTTSITVDTLTADFVRLELTFSDTVGDGPDLLNSVNFNKQKAGRQGPGVLYIGEFDDLAGTRVLNNNDNARDVISDSGDYYAFIGTDGTLANAASSIPGTD